MLQLQQDFILPQMLQGENVPANLAQLQHFVQETGEETLKFYVVFLLGFLSLLDSTVLDDDVGAPGKQVARSSFAA